MRTLVVRSAALLALLPLGGCPLFSAGIDVPEMCVTLHDRKVQGVAPGQPLRRQIIADPLSELGPFLQLDGQIDHARVTLHAQDVPDLMFLDDVTVTVRSKDPGSALAPLWLIQCAEYACASPSVEASAEAQTPSDTLDYLQGGTMQLDITMTGPLPETEWTVDVEICMSGNAQVAVEL